MPRDRLKALIASSEAGPFAKTGGLADAVGNLHEGLRGRGIEAELIMPLYKSVRERFSLDYTGLELKVALGGKKFTSRVFSYEGRAFFTECDEFFNRQELYGTASGEYKDNAERFIFFARAVIEFLRARGGTDIVHANDWQTGLIPFYMKTLYEKYFRKTATVFTIHNLGYQGVYPPSVMFLTGLPLKVFNPDGIEFYGRVNFLKAGIISSTAINTVSENYAREILSGEYGFGLDGVLKSRAKDLAGILNGIDCNEWNPLKDGLIAKKYGSKDLSGKAGCKAALLKECGLKGGGPLVGMVGRLSSQKGIDIFMGAAERIISDGADIVVLGRGEEAFEREMKRLAARHPGHVSVRAGYDEAASHRIYAGSDILLMPSRYEPCGLSQMIAMRYGTVPVARRTGGIADTVEDFNHLRGKGTGFLFSDYSSSSLRECMGRALCAYASGEAWKTLMLSGMKKDFSWKKSIDGYIGLYEAAIRKVRA